MKRRSIFQFVISSFLVAVLTASCGLFGTTDTPQVNNGTKSPVASTEVIKVGAILPLTGPTGYIGEGSKLGMELALKDRQGNTPKIEFIFEDSQGKPNVGVSAASKLLDVQKVNIQVVSTTPVSLATLPAYKQSNKDVLVLIQSTYPGITKGYPFAYRIYATADEETDFIAEYVKKQGYKKIGAFNVTGKSGEEAIKELQAKISAFGGKVVATESFPATEKDFRTGLQKFKSLELDAMFVYPFPASYEVISKQYDEIGLNIPVLGNLNLAFPNMEEKIAPNFRKNVVFPAPRYFVAKDDNKIKAFNDKVKASGKVAAFDIAYSYDMTNILIKSIETSKSTSPKAIGAGILKLMPYEGVSGTIRLNEDRDSRADMSLVTFSEQGIKVLTK